MWRTDVYGGIGQAESPIQYPSLERSEKENLIKFNKLMLGYIFCHRLVVTTNYFIPIR